MARYRRSPDRTGERYGAWTVLSRAATDKWGNAYWLCRCSCGAERNVMVRRLAAGLSTQCISCFRSANAPSIMVSWGGHTMNLKSWCALLGIPHKRVYRRRHDGWPLLRCLTAGADPVALKRLGLTGKEKPVQVPH